MYFAVGDITGGKVKTIVVTLFELFWSIGLILLPAISIFFDSWSYLYVAISSSVFLLVFLHQFVGSKFFLFLFGIKAKYFSGG